MERKRMMGEVRGISALLFLSLALTCCATMKPAGTIKPGDKVRIDFTCRLQNGEIAATTNREIDQNPMEKKASIYLPRPSPKPLVIIAGRDEGIQGESGLRGFEGEITRAMALATAGMRAGETKELRLEGEDAKERRHEPKTIDMARVRVRPKEVKMTPGEYKSRTGKDPEVGRDYTIDPAVPGKVFSVSDREVVIRFHAEPGKVVKTSLGNGMIRETGRGYEIVMDARVGDLIRSGGLVGRIVRVDDRVITIDYGHPFGYEPLKCDLKAERVESADEKK